MSQIIGEQQFHYSVRMTSNKHFPNAIYSNCNAKLEKFLPVAGGKAHFTCKIFAVRKILTNLVPETSRIIQPGLTYGCQHLER